MLYQHSIDHCFITDNLHGTFQSMLNALKQDSIFSVLESLPIITHCKQTQDIPKLQELAQAIRSQFTDVVVLGTGGSTLCPQTLSALATNTAPKLHYADYIDPHEMEQLGNILPWSTTCFIAISKSGQTLETVTQVLWSLSHLQEQNIPPSKLGSHFVIITDPIDNPLRTIGTEIGATILDHVPEIGGRYAAFTNVGLLPALILGLDPYELRQGGQETLKHLEVCKTGAALAASFFAHDFATTVFMPYVSRLKPLSSLFRQLWSESLGKQGKGGTPLIALGTVDQHSQLQLYLDGPKDKWFTLLALNTLHQGRTLEAYPSCQYLEGRTVGDVQYASQQATIETLIKHGRPVRVIQLKELNAKTVGALVMHMMLETIFTAQLLHVNPFDQPAVEDGKKKARTLLASIT